MVGKELLSVVPPGPCKHGNYIGGVGIDWLCPECEDGDE